MKINGQTFIDTFETFAPKKIASAKDPIGLHFGSLRREMKRVLVTLDVRPEVVQEAIAQDVDFIFAHHPPIFRSISAFDVEDPQIEMYAQIIKNDITVYAAHTNLDAAENGMNDWLAQALCLQNTEILTETAELDGQVYGYGRVGNLEEPLLFNQFIEKVKKAYAVPYVRYIGDDKNRSISRVAVMGGDGGSLYQEAIARGADVFVTGDIYYHTAHDMQAAGLFAIDPGHNIEKICIDHLVSLFTTWVEENEWDVIFLPSTVDTDPFNFA